MYYSVYYINILITMFLTTPKISDHFPKISEDFPKLFRRLGERLRTFSRRLPKVAEDFRGGTDDVSIIQHHLWVLFERLCSFSNGNLIRLVTTTWYFYTKYRIFTWENIWIFSVAEILIKNWCLYNNYFFFPTSAFARLLNTMVEVLWGSIIFDRSVYY